MVKVIADTVVLIHALSGDETRQSPIARKIVADSELIAISIVALCLACEALLQDHKRSRAEVARAIETLISNENIRVDNDAVNAGLATLFAKGDFTEGVTIHQGRLLGGETFVSFAENLQEIGDDVRLPS